MKDVFVLGDHRGIANVLDKTLADSGVKINYFRYSQPGWEICVKNNGNLIFCIIDELSAVHLDDDLFKPGAERPMLLFYIKKSAINTVEPLLIYQPDILLFEQDTTHSLEKITLKLLSGQRHNGATSLSISPGIKDASQHLFIKSGTEFIRLEVAEILFVSSEHVYLIFHTATKKIPVRAKMEDMENKLPGNMFLRIHQRYLVNISKIGKLDSEQVWIKENILPISKKYKSSVSTSINSFPNNYS